MNKAITRLQCQEAWRNWRRLINETKEAEVSYQEACARLRGVVKKYRVADGTDTRIVSAYSASEALRLADFQYYPNYRLVDFENKNDEDYFSQLWGQIDPSEDSQDEQWLIESSLAEDKNLRPGPPVRKPVTEEPQWAIDNINPPSY